MFHRACRANARRNVNVFWHITQCCLLFVICTQDTCDKKLTSTLQLIRLNYLILLSHGFLWNLVGKIHTLCTHAKNVCSCTIVWPDLFFCKHLSIVVNKQDQSSMKMAIEYFWPFHCFRIEGQKFGPFLVTKYIKNQSYQNMLLIKVGLLF